MKRKREDPLEQGHLTVHGRRLVCRPPSVLFVQRLFDVLFDLIGSDLHRLEFPEEVSGELGPLYFFGVGLNPHPTEMTDAWMSEECFCLEKTR